MLSQSRHNARMLTLEKLFETQYFKGKGNTREMKLFSFTDLKKISDISKFDISFAKELFENTIKYLPKIDKIIIKYAPDWPIESIPKTDLGILRMAILEGFLQKLTPPKVVINESIELAKEFGNDQSRKFVSGVLGTIYEKYGKSNENK